MTAKIVCRVLPACFILVLWHAAPSEAQDDEPSPFQRLKAESVAKLERTPARQGVTQSLINGMVVDQANFPSVVRMVSGGTCTASVIGPSTVLLAAHCIRDRQSIVFVDGERKFLEGICLRAPGYSPEDHRLDWAVCLLDGAVSVLPYETVDLNALPEPGDTVWLSGYGCTRRGGRLDGALRLGFAKLVDRPAGMRNEPAALYTHADIAAGEAVLCPGDSGGPLFKMSGDDLSGPRSIVGINSRTTFEYGISIFAATGSPEAKQFITWFATEYQQKVCGLNLDLGCK